jgi:hypothetical protein
MFATMGYQQVGGSGLCWKVSRAGWLCVCEAWFRQKVSSCMCSWAGVPGRFEWTANCMSFMAHTPALYLYNCDHGTCTRWKVETSTLPFPIVVGEAPWQARLIWR